MRVIYRLACRFLSNHSCKFSSHDFTLAQLFACLAVRVFCGLSLRRTDALLNDSPVWLANIGLARTPDRSTLCRAFDVLLSSRRCERMLGLPAEPVVKAKLPGPRAASTAARPDPLGQDRIGNGSDSPDFGPLHRARTPER